MSLWTSTIIWILLLQTVQSPAQQSNLESRPVPIEEVAIPSEDPPRRVVFTKKDWDLTQAYLDVFRILSTQNACSDFYGGPRAATTVLNGFVPLVQSRSLILEVSFEMTGSPRVIRDPATGRSYRLFEKTMVNTNGSFYQRRTDPMRKFPSNVGNFAPGSRAARALILLHELGHLIWSENGDWLLPDDGYNFTLSRANTLRVQQACRKELKALQ